MIKQIILFSWRYSQNKGLTEELDSVLANTAQSQTSCCKTKQRDFYIVIVIPARSVSGECLILQWGGPLWGVQLGCGLFPGWL